MVRTVESLVLGIFAWVKAKRNEVSAKCNGVYLGDASIRFVIGHFCDSHAVATKCGGFLKAVSDPVPDSLHSNTPKCQVDEIVKRHTKNEKHENR